MPFQNKKNYDDDDENVVIVIVPTLSSKDMDSSEETMSLELNTVTICDPKSESMIARAADADCYVVMASLDLSMAFDMVNIELLIKRLRIMGMPNVPAWG